MTRGLDKQKRCSVCRKIAWYKDKYSKNKMVCKFCGARLEKTRISIPEIVT